jgi:ATP-dependent helicase STH1/SNF2
LHGDLTYVQDWFATHYKEELAAHPELQDLEDPGNKDSSGAPSTSAGTPQPAASALPKIKLVSNGGAQANGGGAQSDED